GGGEPFAPLGGLGLGLLGAALVAGGAGLGGLGLELLDPLTELGDPGLGLRVGAAPLGVDGGAYPFLDGPQPAFQLADLLAGHPADGLPAFLDAQQGGPGGLQVGGGVDAFGLGEQFLLAPGVGGQFGVAFVERGGALGEEGVLGGAEPLPQGVVDVLGCAAGGLPVVHQLLEPAGGRAPVVGVGQ